jgi:protease-4
MQGRSRHFQRAPFLLILCGLLAGCITVELPGGRPGPMRETVLEGEGPAKVLLLEIDGVIEERAGRGAFGLGRQEGILGRVRTQLELVGEDDAFVAVVLRIHSPGGTATASEILYREILRFRTDHGLPVIAQLMGVATSGAYYVAMASDAVYAHPTTVTGSIGVIMAGLNVAGLMSKLGIEDQTFTAGAYKDAGSPLRKMRPGERQYLQEILDDLHQRFQQVVAEGRPELDAERVAEISDGRIFSAGQAMDLGLIDGIVDLPGAIEEARRRAGVERARVVTFHRHRDWRENIYTHSGVQDSPGFDAATALLGRFGRPDFYYLWLPQ